MTSDERKVIGTGGQRTGQQGTVLDRGTSAGHYALVRWDDGAEESYLKDWLMSASDPYVRAWVRPAKQAGDGGS